MVCYLRIGFGLRIWQDSIRPNAVGLIQLPFSVQPLSVRQMLLNKIFHYFYPMIKTITALFVFFPYLLFSQGWLPVGSRAASMANASICNEDAWAYHHNPGATGAVKSMAIGVSYENRFLLKELQTQGITYVQPLKTGVISAGAQLYGYAAYRTYRVGVGYALKLANKFFAGVQLNYQGIRFSENYGSKNTLTAEAGFLANITDKWKIGVSVFNIGRAKLSAYQDDRLSTVFRVGTSYNFTKKVGVTVEAEKHIDYALRIKAGLEYEAFTRFYIRGGIATQHLEASFGIGYKFKQFRLDAGSAYHQVLGWSPHISFTLEQP